MLLDEAGVAVDEGKFLAVSHASEALAFLHSSCEGEASCSSVFTSKGAIC